MKFEEWNELELYPTDYIVCLRLKYDHEKEFETNTEILHYIGNNCFEWLNDWNEGQQEIYVDAAVPLEMINSEMLENKIIDINNMIV